MAPNTKSITGDKKLNIIKNMLSVLTPEICKDIADPGIATKKHIPILITKLKSLKRNTIIMKNKVSKREDAIPINKTNHLIFLSIISKRL